MSMIEIVTLGCFMSIIWSLVGFFVSAYIFAAGEVFFDFFNPCWIYAHIRVNILGCILLTIFTHILSPIFAIGYWIYKVCTIGRK